MHAVLELLERQRPVVQRRRHPEAVVHQRLFPVAVAVVHPADLRHRLVRFVDEHDRVRRQVIEQRRRRLARQPLRKVPRVVLDPVAVAHRAHHLQVEPRALPHPLCFHRLALPLQFLVPPLELGCDRRHRLLFGVVAHHVVRLGVDRQPQIGLPHLPGERVDLRQRVDLVAPQLDPVGPVVVGRKDLDDVAPHAEAAPPEVAVVAVVEDLHQPPRDLLAPQLLALLEHQQHAVIGLRRT